MLDEFTLSSETEDLVFHEECHIYRLVNRLESSRCGLTSRFPTTEHVLNMSRCRVYKSVVVAIEAASLDLGSLLLLTNDFEVLVHDDKLSLSDNSRMSESGVPVDRLDISQSLKFMKDLPCGNIIQSE